MSLPLFKLSTLKIFDRALGFVLDYLPIGRSSLPYKTPNTILIIKLSAMGDLLCLMPSIRALSNSFPDSRVDLLTTSRSQPAIFMAIPYLRRILLMPSSPIGGLVFVLRNFATLRNYDLIIDYDQSYRISELMALLGRGSAGFSTHRKGRRFSVRVEYGAATNEKVNFFSLSEGTCKHYQKTIAPLDPILPELLDGFCASTELLEYTRDNIRLDAPTVIIYPGSSSNAKFRRWPITDYLSLAEELTRHDVKIIFAGGPDEIPIKTHLATYDCFVDWIDKWTLLEWGWLFNNSNALFVGSDGGLFHLADLLGTPSISIFGPSSETKWGSLNPLSASVATPLSCRPCIKGYLSEVPQECWKGSRECLTSISHLDIVRRIFAHFGLPEDTKAGEP